METPYYFYLLNKQRLSVFYAGGERDCINEFEYFDACFDPSETVDIAGSDGAVYVEASEDFDAETGASVV